MCHLLNPFGLRLASRRPDSQAHAECLRYGRRSIADLADEHFGTGDRSEAHQPNEAVSLTDSVAATKIIALTVRRWCRESIY
jgi:acetylornithine deacetylase/succinyl-diaminopimelate desuccinylase-like protein